MAFIVENGIQLVKHGISNILFPLYITKIFKKKTKDKVMHLMFVLQ